MTYIAQFILSITCGLHSAIFFFFFIVLIRGLYFILLIKVFSSSDLLELSYVVYVVNVSVTCVRLSGFALV